MAPSNSAVFPSPSERSAKAKRYQDRRAENESSPKRRKTTSSPPSGASVYSAASPFGTKAVTQRGSLTAQQSAKSLVTPGRTTAQMGEKSKVAPGHEVGRVALAAVNHNSVAAQPAQSNARQSIDADEFLDDSLTIEDFESAFSQVNPTIPATNVQEPKNAHQSASVVESMDPVSDDDSLFEGLLSPTRAQQSTGFDADDFLAEMSDDAFEAACEQIAAKSALEASKVRVDTADSLVSSSQSTPLTLRGIVLHMFTAAIPLMVEMIVDDVSRVADLGPEFHADLLLEGMPPKLIAYIDECLAKGEPWNPIEIFDLLHPRSECEGQYGLYLIGLISITEMLHDYTGYSANPNGGIAVRLDQHFDSTYRATQDKWLYKVWDNEENPIQDTSAGAISFLPRPLLDYGSKLAFLLHETAMIALFTPSTQTGWWRIFMLRMIPEELIAMFRRYVQHKNPGKLTVGAPTAMIMRAAFTEAAGKEVQSVNVSLPLCELRPDEATLKPRIAFLQHGIPLHVSIVAGSNTITLALWTLVVCSIEEYGFTHDAPELIVTLSISESKHPDHFAQVSDYVGSSEQLGQEFELAQRIMLHSTFTRADGSVGSAYLKRTKPIGGKEAELKGVCYAVSLYEFSTGQLPVADFGRRRVDLTLNTIDRENDEKLFHEGTEEYEECRFFELNTSRPFECKNCLMRFNTWGAAYDHINTKKECMEEWCRRSGLQEIDFRHANFDVKACLAEDWTIDDLTDENCKCRNCNVVFRCIAYLEKHLSVDRSKGQVVQMRPNVCREASYQNEYTIDTNAQLPFKCAGCGKGMKTRSILLSHIGLGNGKNNPNNKCRVEGYVSLTGKDDPNIDLLSKVASTDTSAKPGKYRCVNCDKRCAGIREVYCHLGFQIKPGKKDTSGTNKCLKAGYPGVTSKDDDRIKEWSKVTQ